MDKTTDIFKFLTDKGYIIENKIIGQGAFAKIYPAKKDNKEYVIRILSFSSDTEAKEKFIEQREINKKLSKSVCNNGKCTTECISNNISCSNSVMLMFNNYIVEILKKYDTDLLKYLVDEKTENNRIVRIDKRNFHNLSLQDPKYLINFNKTVSLLWKAVKTLHDNNMAHGDIKPENILVKVENNEISDISLADFDTLCIGKLIKNEAFECHANVETLLYVTNSVLMNNKKGSSYNIEIKKTSDIYAMSLVTLMMWYGFIGFLNNFGDFNNDKDFDFQFHSLTKPESLKERNIFFEKLEKWNELKLSELTQKYKINQDFIAASHNVYLAIDRLKKIMNNDQVIIKQKGGFNYKHKYLKYKKKYLQLKGIN